MLLYFRRQDDNFRVVFFSNAMQTNISGPRISDDVDNLGFVPDTRFGPFFLDPADPRGITSREVYREFQPSLTSSAGPVTRVVQTTGSVHAPPAYTASQLLTNSPSNLADFKG